MLMMGGAGLAYNVLFSDFDIYYPQLVQLVKDKSWIQGIDLDIEESVKLDDIKMLMNVIHKLVDRQNTVIVIEHNLDVIKSADWIIDLGPEGGNEGGQVIASGTPEKVSKAKRSYTGKLLDKVL